jgi:L-asparaginase II
LVDYIDEKRLLTYKRIEASNFRRYGPYRLIAEVDAGIVSIQAVPDQDENLAIRCQDASGRVSVFQVSADHRLMSPR